MSTKHLSRIKCCSWPESEKFPQSRYSSSSSSSRQLLHSSHLLKKVLVTGREWSCCSSAHNPAPERTGPKHPFLPGQRPRRLPLDEPRLRINRPGCDSSVRGRLQETHRERNLRTFDRAGTSCGVDRTRVLVCRLVHDEHARTSPRLRSRTAAKPAGAPLVARHRLGVRGGSMTSTSSSELGEELPTPKRERSLEAARSVVHGVWSCRECGIAEPTNDPEALAREHARIHDHATSFERTVFGMVDPEPADESDREHGGSNVEKQQ